MEKTTEKSNRKIRYTKMVLRESLMELMKTKNILRITVKDLCDMADICRATFYAHYKDQYDLLRQIEEETQADFDTLLDENKFSEQPGSNRARTKMAEEILQYIANNRNSMPVLLSENGDIDFQEKFISRIVVHLQKLRKKHTGEITDNKKNVYYSVFLVHGAIAAIQLWLKNNMDMPIPEIARILIKITQEIK